MGNDIKDIVWQVGDHAESGELSYMYVGCCRQGSCHEEDDGLWDVLVEFHKVLGAILLMRVKDGDLCLIQTQSCHTRKQDWLRVDGLNPEGDRWVGT